MRIIGTLSKWNDDRGFGFITPNQVGEEIFVHISAFPRDGNRPSIGETISFEIAQLEGKTRAVKIQRPPGSRKQERSPFGRSSLGQKPGISLIEGMIALALILTAGYLGYSRFSNKAGTESAVSNTAAVMPVQETFSAPAQFTCDGRQHCSQMNSLEEAKFFIANCSNTKMDGDSDGEPCENQF